MKGERMGRKETKDACMKEINPLRISTGVSTSTENIK
jgi:hypothetical protein